MPPSLLRRRKKLPLILGVKEPMCLATPLPDLPVTFTDTTPHHHAMPCQPSASLPTAPLLLHRLSVSVGIGGRGGDAPASLKPLPIMPAAPVTPVTSPVPTAPTPVATPLPSAPTPLPITPTPALHHGHRPNTHPPTDTPAGGHLVKGEPDRTSIRQACGLGAVMRSVSTHVRPFPTASAPLLRALRLL